MLWRHVLSDAVSSINNILQWLFFFNYFKLEMFTIELSEKFQVILFKIYYFITVIPIPT